MERLPKSVSRRFWRKMQRAQDIPQIPGKNFRNPCLLWMGALDNTGYPVFYAFPGCMGLPAGLVRAHRLVVWLREGPFPRNVQVDHVCRVKRCCEYEHLQKLGPVEHGRKSKMEQVLDAKLEREILEEIL